MEQSDHCLCTLTQITEVVWEQLRYTMQMKAFRPNEYENCNKVNTLFRPCELHKVIVLALRSLNCIATRGLGFILLQMSLKWGDNMTYVSRFNIMSFTRSTFSCSFDPALDFLVSIRFIFTVSKQNEKPMPFQLRINVSKLNPKLSLSGFK